MERYRTKIVMSSIVAATILCLASPLAGYFYIFNGMKQAIAENALPELVGYGLLIAASVWMVGVAALIWILATLHDGDRTPVIDSEMPMEDTDSGIDIIADLDPQVKPLIAAEPTRRAISRYQWNDIMSWAAVNDDVKAITERYNFASTYELVDALPGSVMDDGRYVPDLTVEFMYPAGAIKALTAIQIDQTIRCPSD